MQKQKNKWLLVALAIFFVVTAIWQGLIFYETFTRNKTIAEFEVEARLLKSSIEQWKSKPAMLGGAGSRPRRPLSFSDIDPYQQRTDSSGQYHGFHGRFWFSTADIPSPCASEADSTREHHTTFLIGYNEKEDIYVCDSIR